MSIDDAFIVELEEATENRNIPRLIGIAQNLVYVHLHPMPIPDRLDFMIRMHVDIFGGRHEKIKSDLEKLTKSDDVRNHYTYLINAMIENIPEEAPDDEYYLPAWFSGQVLRFERDLINLEKQTPAPSQAHFGAPRLQ